MTPEEKRVDDHATLLKAATNTYSIPMVGTARKELAKQAGGDATDPKTVAALMVEQRKSFLEGIPQGYRVVADVADSTTSGLKLYYLEPTSLFPDKPRILAIAGTEKWLDWYGNATWGVLKRETPAYRHFLDLIEGDLLKGKKVQVTGHSLGGGIAQYMGYDVAKRLDAVSKSPAPPGVVRKTTAQMLENLEVVTWNSFGVEQALRRNPADYDKDLLAALAPRMTHYRTPYDAVSKLGEPTGTRVTLPSTGWWGVGATHATGNLDEAAITLGGLETAVPYIPWMRSRPVTNAIVRLLEPVGRYLTQAHMKSHSKDDMAALLAAREAWVKEGLVDSYRLDPWLSNEINELVEAESTARPQIGLRMLQDRRNLESWLHQLQFERLRSRPH